jgi:nitric oxide reductase NorQ protein
MNTMARVELEALDINALRALADRAGLTTRRKAGIIAALAADYRSEGAPVVAAPGPSNGAAPPGPSPSGGGVVWPEVPPATSAVNGEYVEPPWLPELEAAATIGHVELMGPAGSGKTLAVHHLASVQGRRLAVVTADGGLRKRDLVGQRELIGGATVLMAAEFAAAAQRGDWALIDEANMSEPDALAFLNGMTDRPGLGGSTFQVGGQTVEVSPDFRCFLTRNPGYVGTRPMNEALRDRFWSIEVPPLSGDALGAMLQAHGIKAESIPDSVWLIDALYKAWDANRISYQISPRRALDAAAMLAAARTHDIRYWLERAIVTKIDAKHDRDAVERVIRAAWTALRASTD